MRMHTGEALFIFDVIALCHWYLAVYLETVCGPYPQCAHIKCGACEETATRRSTIAEVFFFGNRQVL